MTLLSVLRLVLDQSPARRFPIRPSFPTPSFVFRLFPPYETIFRTHLRQIPATNFPSTAEDRSILKLSVKKGLLGFPKEDE